MISEIFTRRDFSVRLVGVVSAFSLGGSVSGFARSGLSEQVGDQEISHTAESIHQEVIFQGEPQARLRSANRREAVHEGDELQSCHESRSG